MDLQHTLSAVLEDLENVQDKLDDTGRKKSRYIGPNGDREVARKLASQIDTSDWNITGGSRTASTGIELLRDVRAARLGDPSAFRRVSNGTKGWVEGSDAAGGFLVSPDQLSGYIPARRAASPLRERCAQFDVVSNEVWIVTEGNSVTVQHVGEGVTSCPVSGVSGSRCRRRSRHCPPGSTSTRRSEARAPRCHPRCVAR